MEDKIWISTDYVPERSRHFLTPRKRYEVARDAVGCRTITDDTGNVIWDQHAERYSLDGGLWTTHTEPLEADHD